MSDRDPRIEVVAKAILESQSPGRWHESRKRRENARAEAAAAIDALDAYEREHPFRAGQIVEHGKRISRVLGPPENKPMHMYVDDEDDENGDPGQMVDRLALPVELIPPNPDAPSGGEWIDESCFPSLRLYMPVKATPPQEGEDGEQKQTPYERAVAQVRAAKIGERVTSESAEAVQWAAEENTPRVEEEHAKGETRTFSDPAEAAAYLLSGRFDALSEQEREAIEAEMGEGPPGGAYEQAKKLYLMGRSYAREVGDEQVREVRTDLRRWLNEGEGELAQLRERVGELEERALAAEHAEDQLSERETQLTQALEAVKRNDKTVYEYRGKKALNRDKKAHPNADVGARWSTPREIAAEALFVSSVSERESGEGGEKGESGYDEECDEHRKTGPVACGSSGDESIPSRERYSGSGPWLDCSGGTGHRSGSSIVEPSVPKEQPGEQTVSADEMRIVVGNLRRLVALAVFPQGGTDA